MESKSKRCYFIDFTKRKKAYMLWDPKKKSVFVNINVIFDGDAMLQAKLKTKDKA